MFQLYIPVIIFFIFTKQQLAGADVILFPTHRIPVRLTKQVFPSWDADAGVCLRQIKSHLNHQAARTVLFILVGNQAATLCKITLQVTAEVTFTR